MYFEKIHSSLRKFLPSCIHAQVPTVFDYLNAFIHITPHIKNAVQLETAVDRMIDCLDCHQYGSWEEKIRYFSKGTLRNIVNALTEDKFKGSGKSEYVRKVKEICNSEYEQDDYRAINYPVSFLMNGLFIQENWTFLSKADRAWFLSQYATATMDQAMQKQNYLIELCDGFQEFECRGIPTVQCFYKTNVDPMLLKNLLMQNFQENEDGEIDFSKTIQVLWFHPEVQRVFCL